MKHISVHVMFTRFSNKVYLFNVYYCQAMLPKSVCIQGGVYTVKKYHLCTWRLNSNSFLARGRVRERERSQLMVSLGLGFTVRITCV